MIPVEREDEDDANGAVVDNGDADIAGGGGK